MEFILEFTFRSTIRFCNAYIDGSAYPCYIFVDLLDEELINEFGREITVKTNCLNLLPKDDDHPALVHLRQAIFDAVKQRPAFLQITEQVVFMAAATAKVQSGTGRRPPQ